MRYRRLNIKDEPLDVIELIAKWHNLTPKIWIPDYNVTKEDILESVDKIKNTSPSDLYIAISEENKKINGFIWAARQETPVNSALILSLYVLEESRNIGIATDLKNYFEDWCKKEGVDIIQSTVHYNNKKMLELNKKLGYVPNMVYMTKKIKA